MKYREFNRNLLIVGDNHVKVKYRMIVIVVLVPAVFMARMLLVLVDLKVNLSAFSWFDWFYYTFFEFVPLLVLVLLSSNSSTNQLVKRDGLLSSTS